MDISRVDNIIQNKHIEEKNNLNIKLVYIGKLQRQKNHETLIELFSKLSNDYSLTIVGEGEDRE